MYTEVVNITLNFNDAPEQLITIAALSNLDNSLKLR